MTLQTMESNAGGMVRRRALKTRFSDKGMGFDSSAFRQQFMGLWCNGSTRRKRSCFRIRTALYFIPCQGRDRGSNPWGSTNNLSLRSVMGAHTARSSGGSIPSAGAQVLGY
jgi:hypothetical protein